LRRHGDQHAIVGAHAGIELLVQQRAKALDTLGVAPLQAKCRVVDYALAIERRRQFWRSMHAHEQFEANAAAHAFAQQAGRLVVMMTGQRPEAGMEAEQAHARELGADCVESKQFLLASVRTGLHAMHKDPDVLY